jgi:hypothetical protein
MEIANRRAHELRAIKEALLGRDLETAVRLMHDFFDIPQPQTEHTSNFPTTGSREPQ